MNKTKLKNELFKAFLKHYPIGTMWKHFCDDAVDEICENKGTINAMSNKYGIPSGIIAGIIFKEQTTYNPVTEALAILDSCVYTGRSHSLGLGAVNLTAARDASNYLHIPIPRNSKELAINLLSNDRFNIQMTAAYLRYLAETEYRLSHSNLKNTREQVMWMGRYNAIDSSKQRKYGTITMEFVLILRRYGF